MNEKKFVNKIESCGNESAIQEVVETNKGEGEYKPMTQEEKERREKIRGKLISAINEVLKQDGFKKQASTWRREIKDVIQVVNLQRGRYAFRYFLNVGVFKKEFNSDNKKSVYEECERFEYLNKEDDSKEAQQKAREKRNILDFEDASDADVEEKIAKIKEIIETEILPFFK